MNIVEEFNKARQAIFDHCGYREDWVIIPLFDTTNMYWSVDKEEDEWIRFSENKEALKYWLENNVSGIYGDEVYEDEIFTQRFLTKWVYRGEKYTLVCVDTHTDGNKLLRIMKNEYEVNV